MVAPCFRLSKSWRAPSRRKWMRSFRATNTADRKNDPTDATRLRAYCPNRHWGESQMAMKRVAPPPSDEQLAAAEQTDNIRRRDREDEIADQQEQERLVLAGEAESEARAAVRASASVLESRPMQEEEPINVETTPPIIRKTRKTRTPKPDTAAPAETSSPPLQAKILTEEIIQ